MENQNLNAAQQTLLDILEYRDKTLPMPGRRIAKELNRRIGDGHDDKNVREIVAHLRTMGYAICATNRGYYLAASAKDIQLQIDSLTSRARRMMQPVRGLQRALKARKGTQK